MTVCLGVSLTETHKQRNGQHDTQDISLGMSTVLGASFMCQPGEASHQAYTILLATWGIFEGNANTHIFDCFTQLHRNMKSTLACDSSSANNAFDRGSFAWTMIYAIERGLQPRFERCITRAPERSAYWERICHPLPMALGIDCTSLCDACDKIGRLPEERRVAFDLLDVREYLEQFGDAIRWVPLDHMLVGRLTKHLPTDILTEYLKNMVYSLNYGKAIKHTKRAMANTKNALREQTDDLQ